MPGQFGGKIIGNCARSVSGSGPPKGDKGVRELFQELFPGVESEFHFADYSSRNCERSLAEYHSDKYPGVTISGEDRKNASESFIKSYQAHGFDWHFPVNDGLSEDGLRVVFEGNFEGILRSVNRQSTPGYPYRLTYDTNGRLFDEAKEEVKERMWKRVKAIYFTDDFSRFKDDRAGWIREGLRDPVRVFPKRQALPKRKPLPRVISSVSVIDQMVERFFFQNFADAESEFYPHLPTKKGIGFSTDHATMIGERVLKTSELLGLPPIASDVAGWEKNFTSDLAENHGEVMKSTISNKEDTVITARRACSWWSTSLMTCPYVLDTGEIIDFEDFNVQRSGDFLTTSSNGSGRGTCAEAVGSVSVECGDDCLEWTNLSAEALRARYAQIGLPVRDVEVQRGDDFLFCSHRFKRGNDGGWLCWLETWQRMLFESSYSRLNDEGTNANYRKEIDQMPDCEVKAKILSYLSRREVLLGSIAGHEQQQETLKDPNTGL